MAWHYDITERKQREVDLSTQTNTLERLVDDCSSRLEQSQALLNSMIENIPVGLTIKSADHGAELVNGTYLN